MGMRRNDELGLTDFLREGVENFTAPTDCSPRAHNPIPRQRSHSKLCCGSRTKALIIYKQTGNLRAVQILLGHTKIEGTVRYLCVDIEDALALAEGMEM